MGRPTIFNKGPLSAAERQRRRRKRLRREKKAAEKAAHFAAVRRERDAQHAEWEQRIAAGAEYGSRITWNDTGPVVPPTREEVADDIAAQVVLALAEFDDVTLDDVIAALDRLRAPEHDTEHQGRLL
jgi:hypothetical protein